MERSLGWAAACLVAALAPTYAQGVPTTPIAEPSATLTQGADGAVLRVRFGIAGAPEGTKVVFVLRQALVGSEVARFEGVVRGGAVSAREALKEQLAPIDYALRVEWRLADQQPEVKTALRREHGVGRDHRELLYQQTFALGSRAERAAFLRAELQRLRACALAVQAFEDRFAQRLQVKLPKSRRARFLLRSRLRSDLASALSTPLSELERSPVLRAYAGIFRSLRRVERALAEVQAHYLRRELASADEQLQAAVTDTNQALAAIQAASLAAGASSARGLASPPRVSRSAELVDAPSTSPTSPLRSGAAKREAPSLDTVASVASAATTRDEVRHEARSLRGWLTPLILSGVVALFLLRLRRRKA